MSSFPVDPDPLELQQALKERAAGNSLKDPFVSQKVSEAKLRRLEALRTKAFDEEKLAGDGPDLLERAERRWELLAQQQGFKNPRNELAGLRNQIQAGQNAGIERTFQATKKAASPVSDQEVEMRQGKVPAPDKGSGIGAAVLDTMSIIGDFTQGALTAPLRKAKEAVGPPQPGEVSHMGLPAERASKYLEDMSTWEFLKTMGQGGWDNAIYDHDRPKDEGNLGPAKFIEESINEFRTRLGPEKYQALLDEAKLEINQRWSSGENFMNAHQAIQDRADELMLQRHFPEEQNSGILRHPYLAEFATGAFDPSLWVNLPSIIKKAPGIKQGIQGAKTATEAIGDLGLGRAVDADWNTDKLAKAGRIGEDVAAELSVAKSASRFDVDKWAREEIQPKLDEFDKLVATPEDKALVWKALNGDHDSIEQVALIPHLQDAYEIADEVRKAHSKARTTFGKGKYYSESGVLMNPAEVEKTTMYADQEFDTYAPLRERTDGSVKITPEDEMFGAKVSRPYKTAGKTSSDMSRNAETNYEDFTADFSKQMRLEMNEFVRGASATDEIQKVTQSLKKGQFWHDVPASMTSDDVKNEIVGLEHATGLKWREVRYNEKLTQVVGEAGKSTKFDRILLPEGAAEHVEELLKASDQRYWPTLMESVREIKSAKGGYAKIQAAAMAIPGALGRSIRASNKAFASLNTVWAGPAFNELNEIGNIALSGLPMGASALSPRKYINGWVAALEANGLKAVAGKEVPFEFGSMKMGDIVELAKRNGVIDPRLLESKEILNQPGNPLWNGVKTVAGIPGKISRAQDEAFKLKVFMHFLEGSDPTSVAKATKKTMEFVPNFNSLGKFEQEVLTSVVPFYTWMRFAGTRGAKQMIEDPRKLLPFIKGHEAFSDSQDRNAPYDAKGMPEFLRSTGMVAPEKYQTPAQQKKLGDAYDFWDKAGRPKPGSDEFLAMTVEHPAAYVFPLAEAAANMVTGKADKQDILRYMFPMMKAMADRAMRSEGEAPRDFFPPIEGMGLTREYAQQALDSTTGQIAQSYLGRQGRALWAMYNLIEDPEEKFAFAMKVQLANQLGYSGSKAFNMFMGEEVLNPLPPGMRGYVVSPEETANYEAKDRMIEAQEKAKRQKRTTSGYR